ncbi:hypothetical protein IC232_21770 [Microvirga sp. BT688]|uniref:hypothetical protein n=1 Tax=Microvirga sp. TaxID=1873136 RepID=UPI00168203BD|nr:hypothetical protein [Microvirga sp.]MBD2749312.1 hypothetical protein [Microvirga sp.]
MGASISELSKVGRRLGELHRTIDRATEMMLDGQGDQRVLDKKIKAAAAERDQLEARLEALEEQAPDLKIESHPTLIKRHIDILGRLQPLLEQGAHADDPYSLIVRELVEHVIVNPDKTLKIVGRLDALTGAFKEIGAPAENVWGAMVAEVRFSQSPRHQGVLFSFRSD